MQKQTPTIITIAAIITLAVVVIILHSLGVFSPQQEAPDVVVQNQPKAEQQIATSTQINVSGEIVKTESISIRTSSYEGDVQALHVCEGETAKTFTSICLGVNKLYVKIANQPEVLVATHSVTTVADAPVLQGIKFLQENDETGAPPTLLISYAKDVCATLGDCGVGMPENNITYKVNLSDMSFAELKHYPKHGKVVWSHYGHQAIFIPSSCGGAGCEEDPLFGYDLDTDKVLNNLTQERAANFSDALDVMGNPLSYWEDVTWTAPNQAEATLVSPDGVSKTIPLSVSSF